MPLRIRTSFKIRNVEFRNRVFVASGTFGYGDELSDIVNLSNIGGIFTKSITMRPRAGNIPPRIAETSHGVLNSIGLANIGLSAFINNKLPVLRKIDTKIIVNIAGNCIEEYCEILTKLEDEEGISGYEINVSCPNVKEGGVNFGMEQEMLFKLTSELRKLTEKPLIIKLTPNVTYISKFARAVEMAGADAISVANSYIGMAVDIKTRKPKVSTVTGGFSGPAIKPLALAKVYEVANAVKIPIFGIGGISCTDDAIEFLIVGASAVQIGTMNFVNPNISEEIARGIEEYAEKNSILDISELIGSIKADIRNSVLRNWI